MGDKGETKGRDIERTKEDNRQTTRRQRETTGREYGAKKETKGFAQIRRAAKCCGAMPTVAGELA